MNQEDIHQLVTEDLAEKIKTEKAELKRLQFNHAVSTSQNPLAIRAKRRDVARLITEFNKRKRESKATA